MTVALSVAPSTESCTAASISQVLDGWPQLHDSNWRLFDLRGVRDDAYTATQGLVTSFDELQHEWEAFVGGSPFRFERSDVGKVTPSQKGCLGSSSVAC